MRSIREILLHDQTVFVRVDFNVPLDDDLNITDDARIKAALPTIEYIIEKGGKIVLGSHLGRPKGKVVPEMRLKPVAKRLKELLGQEIHYVNDCIGPEVEKAKAELKRGEILLLENLRFYSQEQDNDIHFAEQLAQGIDAFIADGFGVIHRKHASTFALPSLIFDKGIGFLIQEEIDALNRIAQNPEQPLVVLIGGIKISDKVDIIRNLAPMSDTVLVGGGVANTFLKGLGYNIGGSVVESDSVAKGQEGIDYCEVALDIWREFEGQYSGLDIDLPDGSRMTKIQPPLDFIAAPSVEEADKAKLIEIGKDEVPEGWLFLDIGPKTCELYKQVLLKANTIFWNGPLGVFEVDKFAEGSHVIAQAIADNEGYAVLGGGDTESVTEKFGLKGYYSHISTGGGASLNFLGKKELPGLTALD